MRLASVLALVAAAQLACVHRLQRTLSTTPPTVDQHPAFLKVHMRDGDLYDLSTWHIDDRTGVLYGMGDHYGIDRVRTSTGPVTIQLRDVALYETNTIVTSPWVTGLAILTGVTIAGGVACATRPKACFGSCPTFYAPDARGVPVLQAEGFSDAIAPSLAHHDIDALWRTPARAHLTLTLTNEAYETHVIQGADLLVAPRPPGGRVISDGEALWAATALDAPTRCDAPEGDCRAALAAVDGRERTSATDPHDLAARETIDLAFPPAPAAGRTGIVIASRQSLVTTFLLYQGLADLGRGAGDWLAALERGDAKARAGGRALEQLVGGIEVQIEQDGAWHTVGEVHETGPLATDVHLVVLPPGTDGAHVRLRLPRGGWRLDYVARAELAGQVTPRRIAPRRIRGRLGAEYAAGRTPATSFPIVTLPGDRYELDYDLPPGNWEVLLDSRGYYLEWMRAAWLGDEHPLDAMRLLLDPGGALRALAPAFKKLEPAAEHAFWGSRYANP